MCEIEWSMCFLQNQWLSLVRFLASLSFPVFISYIYQKKKNKHLSLRNIEIRNVRMLQPLTRSLVFNLPVQFNWTPETYFNNYLSSV